MDEVLTLVRAAFPTVGTETTYTTLYTNLVQAGKNVSFLPDVLRSLKRSGFLVTEISKRPGDSEPQYRLRRVGA